MSATQLAAEWLDITNIGAQSVDLAGVELYHLAFRPGESQGHWAKIMDFSGNHEAAGGEEVWPKHATIFTRPQSPVKLRPARSRWVRVPAEERAGTLVARRQNGRRRTAGEVSPQAAGVAG